ncbi:MAG: hypothetical protein ACOYM2_14200 [Rectinemataceae bacterium]
MSMKWRIIPGLVLSFGLVHGVMALDIDPFTIPVARFGAMGGSHVALADDWSLMFANPAGLASVPPRFLAAQVGARASGPLFDIALALLGGGSMIDNFVGVLARNDYKLYSAVDVAGPLSFGYVGKGLGFGLFNRTHAIVDAASLTSVKIAAQEDVLLIGGYAFGVNIGNWSRFEAGLLAKGYARGGLVSTQDALSLVNIVSSYMAQPFSLETGIGVDFGLRFSTSIGLAFGLACRDLYSPVLQSRYSSVQGFMDNPEASLVKSIPGEVARQLDGGISWSMPAGGFWGLVDSFVVAIDYRRILDLLETFPRNPALNLGIGVESRFLDIISVRAGLSEGYPTAGASLDLSVMRLDLSVWGSELGLEPGARPSFNLMTTLDFSY